ncbi:MAG: hypothetical protein HY690_10925 [Chloroflexi bacterium]|nr:hypothetical protein [Chloroflexota bacterium]
MRRIVVASVLALAFAALTAGAALADGGPHGQYDKLFDGSTGATDKCAACHRPHQGQSVGFLLKRGTQYQLCVTCHDGSVSRLDVLDGIKLGTPMPQATGQVVSGGTLNGGGFDYVNGTPVTSIHNVKLSQTDTTSSDQPWGFKNDTGVKDGTLSADLTCTSCHNPHGSANYRIFKERLHSGTSERVVSVLAYYSTPVATVGVGTPTIVPVTTPFIKNEGNVRGLEFGAPDNKYVSEYYGSNGLEGSGGFRPTMGTIAGGTPVALLADGTPVATPGSVDTNGFALLCGGCHWSYASAGAKNLPSVSTGAGWTISALTKYRHRIEMPYTDWSSPKLGASVNCNPETGPYNPSDATCTSSTLPALRLASNASNANKMVTCLTCHRAHGSASSMTGWALKDTFSGGSSPDEISPAQMADTRISGGTSKSMLLYTDNRAMCEACHQW